MRNRTGDVILSGMERRGNQGSHVRRLWVLAVMALALLSTLAFAGTGSAATAYDAEELRFLELINEYRAQNGLEPVILSDTLTVAAEHHSQDMAQYGFFAHNTESSSYYPTGSKPWDRMEAEGYDYNTAKGENLAVGYDTAEEAMGAWKRSPSHNAAMLDGNYRVMGVARVDAPGGLQRWYWTTDFGGYVDPSAHAPDPSPDTQSPAATSEPEKEPHGADKNRPKDTGALENGGMIGAGAWQQKARDGADLVVEDRARLGAYHDGRDDLRQRIRVGRDTRLVFDVKIESGSEDRGDVMLARLMNGKGKQIAILERYTGRDAAADWRRERLDLSRFAGREVYLSFHVRTDAERLTTFYLDDVSLKKPQGSRPGR